MNLHLNDGFLNISHSLQPLTPTYASRGAFVLLMPTSMTGLTAPKFWKMLESLKNFRESKKCKSPCPCKVYLPPKC